VVKRPHTGGRPSRARAKKPVQAQSEGPALGGLLAQIFGTVGIRRQPQECERCGVVAITSWWPRLVIGPVVFDGELCGDCGKEVLAAAADSAYLVVLRPKVKH